MIKRKTPKMTLKKVAMTSKVSAPKSNFRVTPRPSVPFKKSFYTA